MQSHEEEAYAADWGLSMPYFMGIYRPVPTSDFMNGFHGFPTRDGASLLWTGSLGYPVTYGCILLDTQNAALLYEWAEPGAGHEGGAGAEAASGAAASATDRPTGFLLRAERGADSLTLRVDVEHLRTTPREEDDAFFHQMRGTAAVRGRLLGADVRVDGSGFFETWTRGRAPR